MDIGLLLCIANYNNYILFMLQVGHQGSDGSGHTKQEPNDHDQEKDDANDLGDAVLVSISGKTLKTIRWPDRIPIKDGEVSVRGTYSNDKVEATATCENGLIVHLKTDCGMVPNAGSSFNRTIWTLSDIDSDAMSSLMANSYRGLRDIKNDVKDKHGAPCVCMKEGSLILEFGHDTIEDAKQMFSRRDDVALLLKTILGKYNIKDDFSVNCEIKIIDECDVVPELPTSSTEKEGKGKQYAASQSESGIYSKSSRGEPSWRVKQVVDTDSMLADLSRDEDVDGCHECRNKRDVKRNQVVIHTNVVTFDKPEIRKRKQSEMARKISAVRNCDGGCILCHISGRNKQDRNLNYIDELFFQSDTLPIGEEEIYSHVIQREWYGDTDFVIITVSHATCVCTVSVNSYIAKYGSCVTVSLPQLRTLLFGEQAAGHRPPLIRGVEDLQEGVDKRFKRQADVPIRASEQFYAYRLQRYISAFSKNRSGGSFYIGVNKMYITHYRYKTVKVDIKGCPIPSRDHTAYKQELKTLVRKNMMIIPNIHTKQPCDLQDLVDVAFHHVREDNYVIEISVGTVNGCVFTDKGGPSAYKLDEKGSLCRMSWQEWMEKLRAEPRPT
ncbi:uncharacterized protein LOC124128424 isoform X1 [Haliotis rufescens]|uniref:uncharacterized protein LOC124128424 isoform X1 n=1 Tax=Haliotis rufescens TaxID=6454 RepID=UPI00201E79A9|nr:uncharacterized protein LOC124128424 isoform X1 [Haliotis rufescens]